MMEMNFSYFRFLYITESCISALRFACVPLPLRPFAAVSAHSERSAARVSCFPNDPSKSSFLFFPFKPFA